MLLSTAMFTVSIILNCFLMPRLLSLGLIMTRVYRCLYWHRPANERDFCRVSRTTWQQHDKSRRHDTVCRLRVDVWLKSCVTGIVQINQWSSLCERICRHFTNLKRGLCRGSDWSHWFLVYIVCDRSKKVNGGTIRHSEVSCEVSPLPQFEFYLWRLFGNYMRRWWGACGGFLLMKYAMLYVRNVRKYHKRASACDTNTAVFIRRSIQVLKPGVSDSPINSPTTWPEDIGRFFLLI